MERREFMRAAAGAAGLAAMTGVRQEAGGIRQPAADVTVRRLSWAGVSLEAAGSTLFLDSWEDVPFFGGRYPERPVPVASRTPRRYVAVTHLHRDHYDRRVVARLLGEDGATGALLLHEAVAAEPASQGLSVRPLPLWQPFTIGPFTLVPLPAVDGWGADQVAWCIRVEGRRIFHGGDGLWHGRWWDFGRAYGPFDIAFLPINGVSTPGASPPVAVARTLGPLQAAEAAAAIGARTLVPIHYGVTIPGIYEETPRPLESLLDLARQRGVRVDAAAPGAMVTID